MVSGRFVDTCAFLTPRLARGCVSGWTPQLSTISAVMIRTCVALSRGTLVAVTLQIRVRNFAGPRGARPCCFGCCFCFWPSSRNCWTLARASRLRQRRTHQRLALMRVRRCERFGLGLSFMAFAFYGGAGFVARRARGCAGLPFARNRCDGPSEPRRCEGRGGRAAGAERSGSRRPEEAQRRRR